MPDLPLRKDQNDNIRYKIDARAGGEDDSAIEAALPRNGHVPYSLVRGTDKVAGYDDGRVVEDVQDQHGVADPEEAVSGTGASDGSRWDEDAGPFEEDGHFDDHHGSFEENGANVDDLKL